MICISDQSPQLPVWCNQGCSVNASVGNMARKAKKIVTKRRTAKSKLVDTRDLCKDLVAMAGFLEDRRLALKIYKAVRQLQLLDLAAKNLPK